MIAEVRNNQKSGMTRDKAIVTAIDACIEKGILREFLTEYYLEVSKMLNWEYDAEAEKRVLRKEAERIGEQRGEKRGEKRGKKIGEQIGKQQGVDISTQVINALVAKMPINDIATQCGVPVETVKQLQSAMNGTLAQ